MDKVVAIVELGGHQHLVSEGASIVVNKIAQKEGETFNVPNLLNDQSVSLKVKNHQRGPKISGLKFKAKTRYFKRYGHRQEQTVVEVLAIKTKITEKPTVSVEKVAPKRPVAKKATAAKKPTVSKGEKVKNV